MSLCNKSPEGKHAKTMVFLVNSSWHQSILCLTSRWSYYVLRSNLGFIPICEPWCWYIYLQNWVIYGVNFAKYSSTMEHLVSYSLPVEKWWHQRWSEKLWTDLGDLRYQAGCPLRFFSKPCLITGGSTIATPHKKIENCDILLNIRGEV